REYGNRFSAPWERPPSHEAQGEQSRPPLGLAAPMQRPVHCTGPFGARMAIQANALCLCRVLKAFEFCPPTTGKAVPAGPEWLHESKYDGCRLRVERDGNRVRLITRGSYDWTKRYPWIVEAALKNRQKRFVIDGEAVIPGVDGISLRQAQ